jgi:RimJ/RimL family protein N-acetyltransferase
VVGSRAVKRFGLSRRLGFSYEGTLRQALRLSDGYHDDAVYGVLAEEWPSVSV